MDTLDNASTNPFANADIILQKEGFLLDLTKQNGDATPNGKRVSHDEFDDEDDLGPETDVDTIDDVLVSPTNNHVHDDNNKEEEEKAHLETEHSVKLREEATTPPDADLVNDTSALVDNVTESCEDSDDEWNYIKGDIADKENLPPSETDKEVCDIIDNDTMSHLNPNAAEFVPLSPKIRTESPALRELMDDVIIAQSPSKGSTYNVDMRVPNLQDFESEIKSRPSDVSDDKETMFNFLNGKNAQDIELHLNSTPIKSFKADEFHFGPNATPFTTPAKFDTSEALSTKAIFGDESTASYLETNVDNSFLCSELSKSHVIPKDQDLMSASFYQDKDDNEGNPIDLNKVHTLPDNIDEFIEKSADTLLDGTISDLPEHDPALEVKSEIHVVRKSFVETVIGSELLDIENECEQELKNVEREYESELCFENKENVKDCSKIELDLNRDSCFTLGSPVHSPVDIHVPFGLSSPIPQLSPSPELLPSISKSPDPTKTLDPAQSPIQSPVPILSQSPVPILAQSPTGISEFSHSEFEEQLLDYRSRKTEPLETVPATMPILAQSPTGLSEFSHSFEEHVLDYHSRKIEPLETFVPTMMHDIHSPVPSHNIESPVEDITSSVKDSPLLASSPLCNKPNEVLFELEHNTDVLELVKDDVNINSSFLLNDNAVLSPDTKIETESVTTTEVNSFLERSLLPDVASPLSPNAEETIIAVSSDVQIPLQDVIVKSAVIAPEFPVQQKIATTPTDAAVKNEDPSKPICFKPRVSGTVPARKPTTTKTTTPTSAKATAKPLVKSTSSAKPAATKTTPLKSSTVQVSSPKPASKPITKAPVANGVIKPPVSSAVKNATATSSSIKAAPVKTTSRPTTAPAMTKPPAKPTTGSLTARPASLTSSRTTSAPTVKKTAVTSTVSSVKSSLKPTTATLPKDAPKPRPAVGVSAPTRPKPAAIKPPSKTPDEKSLKEAVNKQTASRTTVSAPKPIRKVEPKVPTTARTSLTNKTSTGLKTVGESKKPQELVRHPPVKTKVTKITTTKETKDLQNGINEKVTVTSDVTIEESQLIIKDVSPVIENSQLVD